MTDDLLSAAVGSTGSGKRKFVLVPMGSAGDVHPVVGLGRGLAARGHEVVVVAQAGVAEMPRRAGLTTVVVGDAAAHEAVLKDHRLWHNRKAFEFLSEHFDEWIGEMLPEILRQIEPGRTTLVHTSLAFAARIAAERTGVPSVTLHLQPSVIFSSIEMAVPGAGYEWMPRLPRWMKKVCIRMMHFQIDYLAAPAIRRAREGQGMMGRVSGVMADWWNSPERVLALFPEWLAAPVEDWPPQLRVTRFPLYDEAEERPLSAELETFLAQGEPPVLLTPGSANAFASDFFREGVEACRMLGRRALLLTRFGEQVPDPLPPGMAWFDYVPFSRVFPRVAAVVHPGGIGTCAQALAAGTPQLLMPLSHDQPDNALRMSKLGVGDVLPPRRFKAARVARVLRRLLADSEVARACERLREQMDKQMPMDEVYRLIEEIGAPRP